MTVVVFAGPSITPDEVRARVDAEVLPPAAQGDVFRCARRRPRAIGLIDGYFERIPAVWHKEVLWALEHGVAVFGAASMGALRAAELHPFGMVGVGWVFEAFRDGLLTDDDEVAVAHASADDRHRPTSEAMVNIRRTVESAVGAGVIDDATGAAVVGAAKARFYPHRSWPAVLDAVGERAEPLRPWLETGRVDQKRLDAELLCDALATHVASGSPAPKVRHRTQNTTWWDHLVRHAGTEVHRADGQSTIVLDDLLDELRVDGTFHEAWTTSLLRILAVDHARRSGWAVPDDQVDRALDELAAALGIGDREALQRWMDDNDMTEAGLDRLVTDRATTRMVSGRLGPEVVGGIADQLRLAGRYEATVASVLDKEERLAAAGLDNPGLEHAGFTSHDELWQWWFERLGRDVPVDLAAWSTSMGWPDVDSLRRTALRERCLELLS